MSPSCKSNKSNKIGTNRKRQAREGKNNLKNGNK